LVGVREGPTPGKFIFFFLTSSRKKDTVKEKKQGTGKGAPQHSALKPLWGKNGGEDLGQRTKGVFV